MGNEQQGGWKQPEQIDELRVIALGAAVKTHGERSLSAVEVIQAAESYLTFLAGGTVGSAEITMPVV